MVSPNQITHPFHPSHPLTLRSSEPPRDYTCDSCHSDYKYTPWFRCEQCDFYMDEGCALMDPITCEDNQEHIQHFSHQHPLPLVNIDRKEGNKCFACRSTCSGPTYACRRCDHFLHKLCAEWPYEVQHPSHPHHPLIVHANHKNLHCKLCDKNLRRTFTYGCRRCSVWLCIKCTRSAFQSIKYREHEHHLYLLEGMHTKVGQCQAYDTYCKQPLMSNSKEFDRTSSFVLRCVDCDFSVHLLCGPLPSTIKHECHIDPLVLVNSVVEDDSDEHYCDVCETARDPRICVYYCKECKYVAHIHCVIDEVINVMKGIRGDHVELKIAADDVWQFQSNSTSEIEEDNMILEDLLNRLDKDEKRKLSMIYKWEETSSKNKGQVEDSAQTSKLGDEDINRIIKLSRFTHQDFQDIMIEFDDLYNVTVLKFKSSDLELKIATVQGYMIPQILSPVLITILHHHPDVCSGSDGTPAMKSFAFYILCLVVKRMCSTMVKDITKDLLKEWFIHLRFVKFSGFKIDFACAHLERLVRAFLGLQASRLKEEIPAKLNQKLADLQQRIMDLQQRIMETKSKLENCKEYGGSSLKSEFMKECLNEAYKLKWSKACDHLFSYPQDNLPISYNWWQLMKYTTDSRWF